MPPSSPETPRRRHRSQQRARILAYLRASSDHPTAGQIHEQLLPELPRLSLGTVYRNLELLCAEGAVKTVRGLEGPTRYDGNAEPHHHFVCEGCAAILDVALDEPRGLHRRLHREHGLEARRVSIDFFGLCPTCADSSATPYGGSSEPSADPA